ncbi:TIGR03086 family protein [Streptomyces armeniacus]|uniref:TIGR03086 family protein n=1 Tax=Streptomyces armeniacus TaxID=83291 RepID=A0A345XQ94_9ACTN|nr:TIGR03086 family metal-binding protein [Streptomyces armeniacus]AXK33810.1 TIGR03086 family protein [Streptomyces armeniacus]
MSENKPALDLTAQAEELKTVLRGIGDDQLTRPTPCEDYVVGDLLEHVMGLTVAFRMAAEKSYGESPAGPPPPGSADRLDPEWRRLLPERLDALAEAWKEPAAWTGEAQAGGVTMPAEVCALVAADELLIHGWDLARATGQPYAGDPALTGAVFEFLRQSAEESGEGEGLFGPPVPVPSDAPLLDRAVGLSGRDPGWSAR